MPQRRAPVGIADTDLMPQIVITHAGDPVQAPGQWLAARELVTIGRAGAEIAPIVQAVGVGRCDRAHHQPLTPAERQRYFVIVVARAQRIARIVVVPQVQPPAPVLAKGLLITGVRDQLRTGPLADAAPDFLGGNAAVAL